MAIAALTPEEKHHPAKFSSPVLETVRLLLDEWDVTGRILDPYGGVGWIHRIATLARPTFAVELEHPWAANIMHANRTVQGDAGVTPFRDGTFAAIATSAVYPNRVRDHHNAREGSERKTYTHQYRKLVGDPEANLHKTNMGAMSNSQYRRYAQAHIREFRRIVVGGGYLLLNMSNSIARGSENNAVEQWLNWITLAGCWIREVRPVGTRRMQFGANHDARVDHEVVIVAQFPANADQGRLL